MGWGSRFLPCWGMLLFLYEYNGLTVYVESNKDLTQPYTRLCYAIIVSKFSEPLC